MSNAAEQLTAVTIALFVFNRHNGAFSFKKETLKMNNNSKLQYNIESLFYFTLTEFSQQQTKHKFGFCIRNDLFVINITVRIG